ncbi:MAG: hypothetical protein OEV44_06670 [Spirochaetota bacterium]|nr:hypothetical protein [Spirochaetota bacterium]
MNKEIRIFITLICFLIMRCGQDPIINLPQFPDPAFVTRNNYTFDGGIATLRTMGLMLNNGDPAMSVGMIVEGIVLNDYDSVIDGVYFDKGFFIQDQNAAIFVRSIAGISVKRGDMIRLNVIDIFRSSCAACVVPEMGRLQIVNFSIVSVISSANKIYCVDISSPTSPINPAEGPIFVKIKGYVSHKNTADPATWGMDSNSWGIRIPHLSDRNLPNVLVGDEIIAFGIVESYSSQIAGGIVTNNYPLWIYNSADSIYDFTIQ